MSVTPIAWVFAIVFLYIIHYYRVTSLLFGLPVHLSEQEENEPYHQNVLKVQTVTLLIVKCMFWITLALLLARYGFDVTNQYVETALLYIGTTTLYTFLLLLGFPCMIILYVIALRQY